MYYSGIWVVNYAESRIPHPHAEVSIFGPIKNSFIEQSYFLEYFVPKHLACSDYIKWFTFHDFLNFI